MTAQIQALTNTVAMLSTAVAAYCSTHDHHTVGAYHNSATCTHKQEGHNNIATADHRFGGSNFWPGLSKVKSSQHNHISYKGKSDPN